MSDRRPKDGADDWRMTDRLHAQHGKGDPFAAAMRATRMSMIITDPRQPDKPDRLLQQLVSQDDGL